MKKILWTSLLIIGAVLLLSSCDKDDDDVNEVTITILEPGDGEVVADASDVHIHIEVESTDEVHEMEVVLYSHDDPDTKIIDYDGHSHEKTASFEQDVDLSAYPSGEDFHLKVEVCVDHDCEEKEEKEIEFSIE